MDFIDPELLAQLLAEQRAGLEEIGDRDFACVLLPDLDYEAQLAAIKTLLERHREAEVELNRQIREIESHARRPNGFHSQQAVDEWVDRVHSSVYQDAAHSMAAVGMLAPFVESLFFQAFQQLRSFSPQPSWNHPRFQRSTLKAWDCHFVWSNGTFAKLGIVKGIKQLSDAVGMTQHLPASLWQMAEALFTYRNHMFHNGFEWPPAERIKLSDDAEQWATGWFSSSSQGEQPWIFYLTDAFISEFLEVIVQVVTGLGAFAKTLIR